MYGHSNASVNMIQYSHNYSNKSGGLWQFKRDELPIDITRNPDDVTTNNTNQVFMERQIIVEYCKHVKTCKNSFSIKILKQFFATIRNAID